MTDRAPMISVVTVVKNGEEFLERTIRSVRDQSFEDREYIMIDGGSTDGTLDIILSHENAIDLWVSEPDGGIYDAMNKGIAMARGRWIHLLNADDHYLDSRSLSKVAEYLSDPFRFYYFAMVQRSGEKEKQYRWRYSKWKLWYSAYLPHPTMFVSREAYRTVGKYDTRFHIAADHDMILRLIKAGIEPVFVDEPVTCMLIGGRSSIDYRMTFREFRDATIKNGLNPLTAEFIRLFKCWKYRVLRKERHAKHA